MFINLLGSYFKAPYQILGDIATKPVQPVHSQGIHFPYLDVDFLSFHLFSSPHTYWELTVDYFTSLDLSFLVSKIIGQKCYPLTVLETIILYNLTVSNFSSFLKIADIITIVQKNLTYKTPLQL